MNYIKTLEKDRTNLNNCITQIVNYLESDKFKRDNNVNRHDILRIVEENKNDGMFFDFSNYQITQEEKDFRDKTDMEEMKRDIAKMFETKEINYQI